MSTSNIQTASKIIGRFNTISLDEMEKVRLLDRVDMKFILNIKGMNTILSELQNSYSVLMICGMRVFGYRTTYFDTPELTMFFDHHNGKLNRYKVRHREYIDSQLRFLEVKYRSNKGRVIKQRIEDKNSDTRLFNEFVAGHTPYNPGNLHRTVVSHFNRFTLVDNYLSERVTIDFNLAFTDLIRTINLQDLVVIEIKQNRVNKKSAIYQALKKCSIRPSTLSKYCVGISLLNEIPKANRFKKILMQINKLSHVEYS